MPAATVMTSCERSSGPSARAASRACCGFTASTMQPFLTARASSAAWTFTLSARAMRRRAEASISTTSIALGGQRLRTSPPIMALAMLPPPMKVTFMRVARYSFFASRWSYVNSLAAGGSPGSGGRRGTRNEKPGTSNESLLSGTKDGGADAHDRRAFGDRGFEVVGHAHRQRVQHVAPRDQAIPQLAQQRETAALQRDVGSRLRDRHEPPEFPAGQARGDHGQTGV